MAKVLIVENDPDLRDLLVWQARGEGREVVTAASGREGIQLIQEHDFDVIVTDLAMETEKAGLDVLRAAKEKGPYTQVIVITSYGTPEISVETMRLGAFDYLERNAPGTSIPEMIRRKMDLALQFREAKVTQRGSNG